MVIKTSITLYKVRTQRRVGETVPQMDIWVWYLGQSSSSCNLSTGEAAIGGSLGFLTTV